MKSRKAPQKAATDRGEENHLMSVCFLSPTMGTRNAHSTFAAMKAARRWLIAGADKAPHYVDGSRRRGALDSAADVARLASYDEAKAALQKCLPGWHLGFALGPDGADEFWQGVDFDAVDDNLLTVLVEALPGYVETSPSGAGLHAIGYGRAFRALGSNGSGIEAYSGGRFFTVTENMIRDAELVCLADHVESKLAGHHKALSTAALSSRIPSRRKLAALVAVAPQVVADLRSALNHMHSDDYALWIDMGHALKSLGDTGRGLWMDWSATSSKFDPAEAARKWDGFAPQNTGHQAVFAKAQTLNWVNPAGNAAQKGSAHEHGTKSEGTRSVRLKSLAEVEMRAIDWLWQGWIPAGYLTLIAGESGAGKSTVLADIAARVTTGAPWPGEAGDAHRGPGRVLWLGSEDSIAEMTAPRLAACGADCTRIVEIMAFEANGSRATFSLQDDLAAVEGWLDFSQGEGNAFTMLVIDPVTSYLPGQRLRKVDLNDAGQLRSILEPWMHLAQKYGLAIVCVTHLAKDTTRLVMHRVLGSAAFVQTCRSLLVVTDLPTNAQGDGKHCKALLQAKNNLPDCPAGGWRFRTEKIEVGIDARNGSRISATAPRWEELDPSLTTQNLAANSRGPVSRNVLPFMAWLRVQFSPGNDWRLVAEVRAQAVQDQIVKESWWENNSGRYLEKENVGGVWRCRLRPNLLETPQSGGKWLDWSNWGEVEGLPPHQSDHYPPPPPNSSVSARMSADEDKPMS